MIQPPPPSDDEARTLAAALPQETDPGRQQVMVGALKQYRDAKAAQGLKPFEPPQGQQQADATKFQNLYSGLDKVSQNLAPDQAKQLSDMMEIAPDKDEATAAAVNTAYIGSQHPELDADTMAKHWPEVKADYAKQALGIDNPDISDKELYGAIGKKIAGEKDEAAMVQQHVIGQMQQAALNGQSSWLSAYSPIAAGLVQQPGFNPQNRDRYRDVAQRVFQDMHDQAAPLMPLAQSIVGTLESKAGGNLLADQGDSYADQKIVGQIKNIPAEQRPLLFSIVQHLTQSNAPLQTAIQDKGFMDKTVQTVTRSLEDTVQGIARVGSNADLIHAQTLVAAADRIKVQGEPQPGQSMVDFINQNEGGRQGGRNLTDQEKAKLTNEVQDVKDTQDITRNIQDLARGTIDPVKGSGISKYWYSGLNAAGQVVPLAIPYAGVPLVFASTVGQNIDHFSRMGYSPEQAQNLGVFAGAVQTPLLFVTGKMVGGAIPGLSKLVTGPIEQTAGAFFKRAAQTAGLETAGLSASAIAQQLAPPTVEAIANHLSATYPKVDWNKELQGFGQRSLETVFTMLPMVLMGTGVATFSDRAYGARYLSTKDIITNAGFDDATAHQILQARDFDAKQAIITDNWTNKNARVSASAFQELFSKADQDNQSPGGAEGLKARLTKEQNSPLQPGQPFSTRLPFDPSDPKVTQQEDGMFHVEHSEGGGGDTATTPEATLDLIAALKGVHGDPTGTVSRLPAAISTDLPDKAPYALGISPNVPGAALLTAAWEKMSNVRSQFADWISRFENNAKLSASKNAVDAESMIYGRQQANSVATQMQRDLGLADRKPLAEEALGRMVEAGMDKKVLQQHLDILEAAKNPKLSDHVGRLKSAVQYALKHFDELLPASKRFNQITDGQVAMENASGIGTERRANYLPHMQDVDDGLNLPFEKQGGGTPGTGFKKGRTFDTNIDSVLAGIKPKTLNAITVLENRLQRGQRAINTRQWVEAARNIVDPSSNLPVVAAPEARKVPGPASINPTRTGPTPPAETEMVAPKGYELRNFGGQQVAVHSAYTGLFDAFMNPSDLSNNMAVRGLTVAAQEMKHATLGLDIYHLSRMAYYQLGFGASPIKGFKYGMSLLDHTEPELREMAKSGQLDQGTADKIIPQLSAYKDKLDQLTAAGLNVGAVQDNLHSHIVQTIPGMKGLNKFIFDSYTRGGMAWAALLEHDRQSAANPGMSLEEISRRVALDINTRFANLGNQSWVKSKTMRNLMNLNFLSPSWNEGLIRSELGGVKQLGEAGLAATRGKIVVGGLLKNIGSLMVGQFVFNQAINLVTRGQPTWQNKEEGFSAKTSAYIPDPFGNSSGFFLNPFTLPAEITGQIIKGMERNGSMAVAAQQILEGKEYFLGKAADIFLTHKDFTKPILNDRQMAWALTKAMLPVVPIQAAPAIAGVKSLAAGHTVEDFPGQIGKQIISTAGIKADSVPSNEGRIYGLAATWKHENGVGNEIGDKEPGDYRPLMLALKGGDDDAAQDAMKELLDKKTAPEIAHYLNSLPGRAFVSGKNAKTGEHNEEAFESTLNDEQKQTLGNARQDREKLAGKAMALLEKLVPPSPP